VRNKQTLYYKFKYIYNSKYMVDKQEIKAICVLNNIEKGIKGVVRFLDNGVTTKISCQFTGLPKGKHGFHIHEFGDLSNGCVSAGAHYNPFNKTHGGPDDEERHVGDLGNINADKDGNAEWEYEDKLIRLTGPYTVIGRSVICHEKEDDLGRGNEPDSKTTGAAGARIVCGIIGLTTSF
jgi:superoxide dismutase, Cu-Zn family